MGEGDDMNQNILDNPELMNILGTNDPMKAMISFDLGNKEVRIALGKKVLFNLFYYGVTTINALTYARSRSGNEVSNENINFIALFGETLGPHIQSYYELYSKFTPSDYFKNIALLSSELKPLSSTRATWCDHVRLLSLSIPMFPLKNPYIYSDQYQRAQKILKYQDTLKECSGDFSKFYKTLAQDSLQEPIAVIADAARGAIILTHHSDAGKK